MNKSVDEFDWDEIKDALFAYADYVEREEPHAINTIALFRNAADECPSKDDF